MSRISDEIKEFKNIEVFQASHQKIRFLPKSLLKLTNLKVLNLKNNMLTEFSEDLKELPQLQIVDLLGNPLSLKEQREYNLKWRVNVDPQFRTMRKIESYMNPVKTMVRMMLTIFIMNYIYQEYC